MGLDKSYTDGSNVVAGYWGTLQFNRVDYKSKTAVIILDSYTNKTDRDAGKDPISNERFNVSDADFDSIFDKANTNPLNQNAQERAYVYIKALATSSLGIDWTTATDNI